MQDGERKAHWEAVYEQKAETEVSWFQEHPSLSLDLIAAHAPDPASSIIDVGGGASRLVDELVLRGYGDLTVLDLSQAALKASQARLGAHAGKVTWICADATRWRPLRQYDLWHDRAALHFLTSPEDRTRYVERLVQALRPGGHAIIATFALDGPQTCSGLSILRYDAAGLGKALGDAFSLVETRAQAHVTPWGAVQEFQVSIFRRNADRASSGSASVRSMQGASFRDAIKFSV